MKAVLIALLLCVSASALAAEASQGNEGANGGDEVALEFRQAFASAVARTQSRLPYVYEMITKAQLPRIMESAVVLVTDSPLTVKRNGLYQESIAINYPDLNQIILNRQRWKELRNEIKEALALHEVAGLARQESTGEYPISGLYLGLFSLDIDPAYDFTPLCGRLETQILSRAEENLQYGRGTILDVKYAALDLQMKLYSCQRVNIQQFCEIIPSLENFVVEELRQAVEKKLRGEYEYLRAIWSRDANKRRCAILRYYERSDWPL